VSTDTLDSCYLRYPPEFGPLIFGAVSLLLDVNMWQRGGALSPEELVDVANNYILGCDVDCKEVVDCLNAENGLRLEDCVLKLGDEVVADLTVCGNAPPDAAQQDLDDVAQNNSNQACSIAVQLAQLVIDISNDWLDIFQAAADSAAFVAKIMDTFIPDPSKTSQLVSEFFSLFSSIGSAGVSFIRSQVEDQANYENLICDVQYQILCDDDGRVVIDNVKNKINLFNWGSTITNTLVENVVNTLDDKRVARYAIIGREQADGTLCSTCSQCPDEYRVTFDSGGYTNYSFVAGRSPFQNVSGVLNSVEGNPTPCGEREAGTYSGGTQGAVTVLVSDLPFAAADDIGRVSMDYLLAGFGSGASVLFGVRAITRDGSGNDLEFLGGAENLDNNGRWNTVSWVPTSASRGAQQVLFEIRRRPLAAGETWFVDNLTVEGV
jgi:hypothetical protein